MPNELLVAEIHEIHAAYEERLRVGRVFVDLRERVSLKPWEVARKCKTTTRMIRRLESGAGRPAGALMMKLCKVYGVSMGEISSLIKQAQQDDGRKPIRALDVPSPKRRRFERPGQ